MNYSLRKFLSNNICQFPVTGAILGPNIFLCALLSIILKNVYSYFGTKFHTHTTQIKHTWCERKANHSYSLAGMHWSWAPEFCRSAPNIYGSSVWNLPYVTLLASIILRCLMYFWKICAPLKFSTSAVFTAGTSNCLDNRMRNASCRTGL